MSFHGAMVSLHTVPVAYLHRAVVSLPCPHAAMVSLNIAIVNLHGAIETLLSFLHRRLKRVNRTCTGFILHVPLQIGARTVHIGKFRGFFYGVDIGRKKCLPSYYSDTDYFTSSAATTILPRRLKSTRRSQVMPIR